MYLSKPTGFVFIDFEYNNTAERHLNVVCVAWECWEHGELLEGDAVWLENSKIERIKFRRKMKEYIEAGFVFVSWAVTAEAGAFFSLGIHPYKEIRWVDLYLEYRMLTNHNHKYAYGKQLIAGKPRTTKPPKPRWERTAKDAGTSAPTEHNLAAGIYKMLGVVIDTDHKTEMRDLIISGGPFDPEAKQAILDYCKSDVKYLPDLYDKLTRKIKKLLADNKDKRLYLVDAFRRGDYAARTAWMERVGHPIDFESTKNFSTHVETILYELSQEITESFPEIEPFQNDLKAGRYRLKEKHIKAWIVGNHTGPDGTLDWEMTDHPTKPQPKLSLDAFLDKYPFRHEFPPDNFGAQMVRFLKTRQALNGFLPSGKGRRKFWDYVGSDGRVRPHFGIYASQSARSQPSATSFIPLKASWMRVLIQPPRGYCYISVDYSSQEFLIGALLSKDKVMIQAYHSGDPYLYTAKVAGAVPSNATKQSHPQVRERFKATVLGILYLMGAKSLAAKLTNDTGVEHTEDEARNLINLFDTSYPGYKKWRKATIEKYRSYGYLRLPCGWVMFGDNPNYRSIANFPVQGHGSSIMREAVRRVQDAGYDVAYTLHDELCVLAKTEDVVAAADALATGMDEAFKYYFKKHPPRAKSCRLGAKIWSPDFEEGQTIDTEWFPKQQVYPKHIDPRSINEYQKYKKYFDEVDDSYFLLHL